MRTIIVLAWLIWSGSLAAGEIKLLGTGTLPGNSADLSGLPGTLSDGTPHNRLGGMGSAIAYSGQANSYLLASDRGPKDGATDFVCRVHRMDIVVQPGAAKPVDLKLTATTLLTDEAGRPFLGSLTAFDAKQPERSMRLDPEGIRMGRSGHFYISDEYGPFVYEFSPSGKRLRALPVPRKFLPRIVAGKPEEEMPPHNKAGRQPNRGMEGLAISPDGTTLMGIMQSPLIQDGGLNAENKRVGLNSRMIQFDLVTGKTKEFIYPLDDAANGVSEILAVNTTQFLVLERDSKGGLEAQCKKIFLIDLDGASEVSDVAELPAKGLPSGLKAVKKQLFLNLLDPKYGLHGPDMPEKIEGICFGPDLPDGRKLLIVTADNDFVETAPFRVYAFAVDPADLPGYVPQKLPTGR
ncbi:MAG TPA: esterase-like activity of phytase family protein [Gemmatales bacterium]|nr:esterase-like activity of phytase family protein [Gemmatales bacterium]